MELKRPYLFLFFAIHVVIGICCLLVTIAIAVLEGKLQIQCGLFIEVKHADVFKFKYSSSTSKSTCQYLKWMPGMTFVISVALAIYHFYPGISRQPWFHVRTTICWVITIITGFLLFVASCIISAGFQKSCRELETVYKSSSNMSCKDMFDSTTFSDNPVDTAIYTFLSIAEACCWIAFLFTVICIIISSLHFFWRPCRDTMSTARSS